MEIEAIIGWRIYNYFAPTAIHILILFVVKVRIHKSKKMIL